MKTLVKFQCFNDIGGAISSGFGYLMDHPEIASGLVKVSAGVWA